MRIAICGRVKELYPGKIGGLESFHRRIAYQLVKEGHEVDYHLYGPIKGEITSFGPKIKIFYYNSHEEFRKKANLKLYQLIHITMINMRDVLKLLPIRIFTSTKIYLFCFYYEEALSLINNKKWRLLLIKFVFHKIIGISPRIVRVLNENNLSASLIYPPVSKEYFCDIREKQKLKEQIIISYMGRIDQDKGLENVLNVFQRLKESYGEKIKLQIIGSYSPSTPTSLSLHKEIQNLKEIEYVARELDYYTSFGEDFLLHAIRETDILFLPYANLDRSLDLPLLVLEGIASLCIIISTPVGDIPEILQDKDLIGTREELYGKIADLVENRKTFESKKNYIAKLRDNLSIEVSCFVNQYLNL
ncbi:MAG: glycosyltransferase [bacterium]